MQVTLNTFVIKTNFKNKKQNEKKSLNQIIELKGILDEATTAWGIKVERVEM